ncbi:hypothetical protein AA313_de0203985 [Arthrobotrys entomopaga]|nr:hypothetical protein AA313_de0203985 [Arthrobotrys entomopaga]
MKENTESNDKSPQKEPSVADVTQPKIPNLFPVYLPYPAQHILMTEAQRILERACYDYTGRWLPEILDREQFQHPENAELSKWVKLLEESYKKLPHDAYDESVFLSNSLTQTVFGIVNLRHTAVHRIKTHSKGLEDMLEGAVRFARFLKDETNQTKLQAILDKARELSLNLEAEKILLQSKLEKELVEIETAKRELIRREAYALEQIIHDDKRARNMITLDVSGINKDDKDVNDETDRETDNDTEADGEIVVDTESGNGTTGDKSVYCGSNDAESQDATLLGEHEQRDGTENSPKIPADNQVLSTLKPQRRDLAVDGFTLEMDAVAEIVEGTSNTDSVVTSAAISGCNCSYCKRRNEIWGWIPVYQPGNATIYQPRMV